MATALSAILVENSGGTGLLYISDISYPNHQQILVHTSIITILVHTSFVLNDSRYLLVDLCLWPCLPAPPHLTPIIIYSIHSSQRDHVKVLVL